MLLAGYDWGPVAVDLATEDQLQTKRYCTDSKEYKWQHGASYIGECMLTGRQSLITAEHALHVLEVIQACRDPCNARTAYLSRPVSFVCRWPVRQWKKSERYTRIWAGLRMWS